MFIYILSILSINVLLNVTQMFYIYYPYIYIYIIHIIHIIFYGALWRFMVHPGEMSHKSPECTISWVKHHRRPASRWLRLRGDGHLRCHAVRALRLGSDRFGSVRDFWVHGWERTGEFNGDFPGFSWNLMDCLMDFHGIYWILMDFQWIFNGLFNGLLNGF